MIGFEAGPQPGVMSFFREELSLRPGRAAAIARIAGCCTLIVVIWMVFRIPEPAYAAYVVFLISGADAGATLIAGVAALIAVTLAIGLSIFLYTFDAAEPALRLPLMAISIWLGMFLSRTIAIGPIAFLLGFLLVITQTIVDGVPNTEVLTRFLLWLWLAAAAPAVLTVLVNLWAGQNPAQLLRSSAVTLLGAVADSLREPNVSYLAQQSAVPAGMIDLRHRAAMLNASLHGTSAIDAELIEALDGVVKLAIALPDSVPAAVRAPLQAACSACRDALAKDVPPLACSPWPATDVLEGLDSTARPMVMALATLLERLSAGLAQRLDLRGSPQAKTPDPKAFFLPDAFTNPEHMRFALKATLAALAAYFIYSGLDWPGIRTSMITCFFVALGSVGETVHKLTLRVSGALLGGLLGGLCIIFVLPHMTDIGQLALLVASVAALCAWVSTSSDLLAYAGMQMALAFFLGVFQSYGPTTELTVLRDRVIGIVLGNVIMSIVFSVAWPVSARTQARAALAGAARSLSELLRSYRPRPQSGAQLSVTRAINQARRLAGMSTFETHVLPATQSPVTLEQQSMDAFAEMARAAFVVVNQPSVANNEASLQLSDDIAVSWIEDCAAHLVDGGMVTSPPKAAVVDAELNTSLTTLPVAERAVREAHAMLLDKIRSFAAYVA
jgi:multidrug resistance protein MdtO